MPKSEVAQVGDLLVRSWPCSSAKCLVLVVHGHSEHSGRYEYVAEALAARGASVVAPDLEGHGLDPREHGVIADFDSVLEELHHVTQGAREELPVVMIGHSLGGLVAVRYAQLWGNELTGLVLSAPALGVTPIMDALLDDELLRSAPTDPSILSRDSAVGAAYLADPLVFQGWQLPTIRAIKALDTNVLEGTALGDLPVLYLHGADDRLVPSEMAGAVVGRIAGDRVTSLVVPGGRHEIFNEPDRDDTIAIVSNFIASLLPST